MKLTIAAVALSAAAFAATAHAGDEKTYSASECVATPAGGNPYYDVAGRFFNVESETRTLVCPIINDKEQSSSVLTSLDIYVVDRNPSLDVDCRIVEHIESWTGWGPAVSSVGASSTYQKLTSSLGGNRGIALSVLCHLPPIHQTLSAIIDRYTVVETN
jgi:hypothetical protein